MVELEVEFLLNYEVLDAKGADFIFNLHAARTLHQSVDDEELTFNQDIEPVVETDPVSGTRFMRLHAQPGPLHVAYRALVTLQHHRAEPDLLEEVPMRALPLSVMPYVYPSRYCQSDRLFGLAMREFGGLWKGYSRVLAIQHWVQNKVAFVSNTSNGNTSALDTLIDRQGVCRDFAHLMIALCRALNIPARVATGTDYGASEALGAPDFHAYVEVYLGDRWYIFDPSGTGIPMGFIRMGTGRDAADVAFATLFGQVIAGSPIVRTTARRGPGLDMPSHGRDALSTTAMIPV